MPVPRFHHQLTLALRVAPAIALCFLTIGVFVVFAALAPVGVVLRTRYLPVLWAAAVAIGASYGAVLGLLWYRYNVHGVKPVHGSRLRGERLCRLCNLLLAVTVPPMAILAVLETLTALLTAPPYTLGAVGCSGIPDCNATTAEAMRAEWRHHVWGGLLRVLQIVTAFGGLAGAAYLHLRFLEITGDEDGSLVNNAS